MIRSLTAILMQTITYSDNITKGGKRFLSFFGGIMDKRFFESLESCWDRLKSCGKPIYIYGMGNGSEKILHLFDRFGISCSGIFASDDFVRGQSFCGFKVQRFSDVMADSTDKLIVLGFGSSLDEIMARVQSIEEKFELVAPDTSVTDSGYFDKERFFDLYSKAERAYSLLEDDLSRKTFECITAYKITGSLKYLRECFCDESEANSLLCLGGSEQYFDLGAYRGDTVESFVSLVNGKYKSITAVEPNVKNFRKCEQNTQQYQNVTLYNAAAWSECTTLTFSKGAGRQAKVSQSGEQVSALTLDSIAQDGCTFVKYDVEGADCEALLGSVNTIRKFSPKICAALYHKPYDYFLLPLMISRINADYKLYMRQSRYYPCWETNLYCIPR
ncbi:MAG: FkbM family methyltransferase [Ruminococcus sp.]|nr:FkbM family methyltransferase [Ruminococcus sp.]